jgi:hypothetical protein
MVKDLITEKTLMVGFPVMTSQIKFSYDLSKILKTVNPKLKIVCSGAHTNLFHKGPIRFKIIFEYYQYFEIKNNSKYRLIADHFFSI